MVQSRTKSPSLQFAFSSARKVMTTVVEQTPGGRVRVYTTGGSDVVLAISTHVLKEASAGINSASTRERLSAAEAASLAADVVASMARRSLRTLGLAYREFESQAALPAGWHESPASLETDMTLHSLLGIKDPLRPVRERHMNALECNDRSSSPAGSARLHRQGASRGHHGAHGHRGSRIYRHGHRARMWHPSPRWGSARRPRFSDADAVAAR